MTVHNSDRFTTAYNRVDQLMKDTIETQDHIAFFRLIDLAKKKNAIIRRYEADLREYGDLRNAIVHHRTSTEYAIAEPHEDVVLKMEEIEDCSNKTNDSRKDVSDESNDFSKNRFVKLCIESD